MNALRNYKLRLVVNRLCSGKKAFSTGSGFNISCAKMLPGFGCQGKTALKRGRPETFVGDLQEVLKLGQKNINAFFFSWSITCRVGTVLLCLLLL
jgi:hypothetical protein